MTHETGNGILVIIALLFILVGLTFVVGKVDKIKKKIKVQEIAIEEHKTDMVTFEKNLKDGFARACVEHGAAEYDKKSGELYFVNECEDGCGECGKEYMLRDLLDSVRPLPPIAMEKVNE